MKGINMRYAAKESTPFGLFKKGSIPSEVHDKVLSGFLQSISSGSSYYDSDDVPRNLITTFMSELESGLETDLRDSGYSIK